MIDKYRERCKEILLDKEKHETVFLLLCTLIKYTSGGCYEIIQKQHQLDLLLITANYEVEARFCDLYCPLQIDCVNMPENHKLTKGEVAGELLLENFPAEKIFEVMI